MAQEETGTSVNGEWKQTACMLCHINCGVEVLTEDRKITKVRPDKANPGSHGYFCQKAQRLTYYGDHADRLISPLKRQEDGSFAAISWDRALDEIANRLKSLTAEFGPRSLAYYGGGGQGNHLGGGYGVSLTRALGSSSLYTSLAQERTGDFWINRHLFGAETCNMTYQLEDADLAVFIGANPWMSHGFPAARRTINGIINDPDRHIIVIDPVQTHTAKRADLHLQLKPGTDAYLLGAILALLHERGDLDYDFLESRTTGAEDVLNNLKDIPADAWIAKTGVVRDAVDQAVEMIAASGAMSVRADLGILQTRNSTLNSYMERLLTLLTGHFNRPGTNVLHSWLQPLWGNSRGATSAVTGMQEIAGILPPNKLPAEILSDHPERIRAVIVDSSNPANSAADTQMMEKAFERLDMLVVIDVAMTETAQLADYVLPASSQYEKWEFTLFTFEFPTNVIHLRAPLFEPLDGTMAEPEIYARLAEKLGILPADEVLAELGRLAADNRLGFAKKLGELLKSNPAYRPLAPIILYLALGQTLPDDAAGAVVLWPACHRLAKEQGDAVRRALGVRAESPELGEILFARFLNSRSGTPFSTHELDEAWGMMRNKDGKIHLAIPEMLEWLKRLDPSDQPKDADYPYTLMAGQRRSYNVNQIMRHPAWRPGEAEGTLRIRPEDLQKIGAIDGGWLAVKSRVGRLTMRAEVDETLFPGVVVAPHGYGMSYPDGKGGRVVDGPRVNILSAIDDCDPIAATPHHKAIPVGLKRASNEEADQAEQALAALKAIIAV